MSKVQELLKGVETKIQNAYVEGITQDEAERFATELLHAHFVISGSLRQADLDSRMKKTGVKAIRAAIYMAEATKTEKKPSDVMLQALVDSSDLVNKEQDILDTAEVDKAELERIYGVLTNAHIHFRTIAKGGMG